MGTRSIGEELKKRIPRFIISLTFLISLLFIYNTIPLPFSEVPLPGLNIGADQLIRLIMILTILVLLAKILPDAFFLADLSADILLKRLGMGDKEKPLKRASRDLVYIIITILLAAAALPFLSAIPDFGSHLTAAASLIALGVVLLLIYDVGKIIYGVIEEKAESIANWITEQSNREK